MRRNLMLSRKDAHQLFDALNTTFYGYGTGNEKPGCDCGCGGDSIDWDQVDEDNAEAEATLERLGIEIEAI